MSTPSEQINSVDELISRPYLDFGLQHEGHVYSGLTEAIGGGKPHAWAVGSLAIGEAPAQIRVVDTFVSKEMAERLHSDWISDAVYSEDNTAELGMLKRYDKDLAAHLYPDIGEYTSAWVQVSRLDEGHQLQFTSVSGYPEEEISVGGIARVALINARQNPELAEDMDDFMRSSMSRNTIPNAPKSDRRMHFLDSLDWRRAIKLDARKLSMSTRDGQSIDLDEGACVKRTDASWSELYDDILTGINHELAGEADLVIDTEAMRQYFIGVLDGVEQLRPVTKEKSMSQDAFLMDEKRLEELLTVIDSSNLDSFYPLFIDLDSRTWGMQLYGRHLLTVSPSPMSQKSWISLTEINHKQKD